MRQFHRRRLPVKKRFPNPMLLIGAMALLMFATRVAWARAGGGGGYHGSGGGNSSNGGGSDGGVALFYLFEILLRLILDYPVIGIPLTCALLAAVWYIYRRGDSVWSDTPDHGGDYSSRSRQIDAACDLSELKARDPAFDEEAFRRRVRDVFLVVQNGWSNRTTAVMRPFVTDGVLERFDILLDLQARSLIRNVMDNVLVHDVKIRALRTDQFFDTLEVKVAASAIDYYVEANRPGGAPGAVVSGSRNAEAFVEFWTFLRKPDVKSRPGQGLEAGQCPSCGAPLQVSDRGECQHCHALVTSGRFDWVLAEITQTSAVNGKARPVAGLPALMAKDPAFNVQYAEDRASVIFWRLRAAEALGTPAIAEGIAGEAFAKRERKHFQKRDDGSTQFFADPAVGSVELVEVLDEGDGFDRLGFRIKWSGRPITGNLPAFIRPDFAHATSFDEEFVLMRSSAAKTSTELGLATRSCANCGAAATRLGGAACRSCGIRFDTGAVDWVLDKVAFFTGARTRDYEGTRRAREPGADDAVAAAIALMKVDGNKSSLEVDLVREFARSQGISEERFAAIANSTSNGQLPASVRFVSAEQKKRFISFMLQLALVDGSISPAEEQLLLALEKKLDLKGMDVATEIGKARAATAGGH